MLRANRFAAVASLCVLMLIAACASTGMQDEAYSQKKSAEALAPWINKGEVFMLEIPAPNNFLSAQMVLLAFKSGSTESQAVDKLVATLRANRPLTIAVMGQNAEINEATVNAALSRLSGTRLNPGTELVLVGNAAEPASLQAAATRIGLKFGIAPLKSQ